MVKKSLVSEGSLVEVRSDEDGFRDVYFLATVTTPPANFSKGRNAKSKTSDRVYVEYRTLLEDEKESDFLREFVDLKYLRPAPPPAENVEGFEVDDVVDAYYSDGWWIGVVKKVEEGSKYVVSFQDPPDELTFGMSELRVHWDWVDGHWIRPEQQSKAALMFDVGRNVEVSIEEDNCLNAWFPATIHEIVKDGYFVVELSQKVGNEAESSRVTVDRLHVRPIPPHLDPKYRGYALSDKVDVFIDGGWWSGVIRKELEDVRYAVFFEESEKTKEFHGSEMRHHMEWRGTKWITSFQDVLMPSSSDSEKQGGYTAPVGSSDEGKISTKERMPRLHLTHCNNELSHVVTARTKRRCNLPSDSLDDLSLPLKRLKLGTLEASASLAPGRKITFVTSSNAMVCGSESPTSGSTRISSDKRTAFGDLSSNNSCRGRRIGRQNVEQDSSTSGSIKKSEGRGRQNVEQDTSGFMKKRGRGRKNAEQDSPTSGSMKKRGGIHELQVKNPKCVVGGLVAGKETPSDHGDHLSIKEFLKPGSEMDQDQQSYDSAMQRIKDNPAAGSMKERRKLKLRVKRSELVVEDLATGKASSNDTRNPLLTNKEPSMPVSEQEKQSNGSMVESKKDKPTSGSLKKERTQDLQFQSSASVVGGMTTRKMSSGNKSDLLSVDTESLKCVSKQEQKYNDSASQRMKDLSTSSSMNKGGRTEELQAKCPKSVVGGFCQMLIASSFAAGKASLTHNRDHQSINMESLRPDSEQDLQLNDPVMQRMKESDQAETGEGTRKRKRGRPRKIPIESHHNQVTDIVQSGDVAGDEMARKDSKGNEVGSHTTVEVNMIGKGGILNYQESAMHDKNSDHPKQNNLSGSVAEKTHTKMSDVKVVERSTNPNENHSSMEGRTATDGNSASQVQDSLDAPGSRTLEPNRIVNESKKAITVLPSTEFDDEPLSKWIEEMQTLSRASGDQCVEETTGTQKEIALLADCSERQKQSGIETNILGDKGSIVLSEPQSLPFVKNTILWSTIESMDVFQKIPQKPHFQPLQLVKESSREGIAIGLMVTFSSVVEKALRLKFNDPKSILDDILENLEDLERHGFDVQAVRDRVCAILSVKDRKEELLTQVEQISSQIAQQNLEINHMDEEINEIEEQMKKLQEKLSVAESAKAKKDCLTSSLKSKIREIEESIEAVVRDFEGLAAAPF